MKQIEELYNSICKAVSNQVTPMGAIQHINALLANRGTDNELNALMGVPEGCTVQYVDAFTPDKIVSVYYLRPDACPCGNRESVRIHRL